MFNDLKIRFNIIPRTLEDAEQWVNWLLKHNLTEYLSRKRYFEYEKNIRMKFPSFEIKEKIQEDLIAEILKNKKDDYRRKFWLLQTPLDLLLEVE